MRTAFKKWFRDCRAEARTTIAPLVRTFHGAVFRANYSTLKPNGLRAANMSAAETRGFAFGSLAEAAGTRRDVAWHTMILDGARNANDRARTAGFYLP